MGEPGQRLHSNGHPAGQGFAHAPSQQMHPHQQAQYSATGHLPPPRRSSIQSMLNPSSPDPGSYGYYPAPHSQHTPPQHHMQQQQPGQHQYIHPMQQQPVAPPQHHHQYHSHPQHAQHPQHPPHQEHYHDDDRQYSQQQQQQQAYPYQPYPPQHPQPPSQSQQQRPQQQHLHQPPHVGHPQQSSQQQVYYPSQPAPSSTQAPSSLSMNAAPYPGSSNALPPLSSQPSFRSHGQYSPGAGSSDPTFQTPPSSALQAPLQTSSLSHHQQSQQRHMHNAGVEPGKHSPVTGAHPHGSIPAAVVAGTASLGNAPPRHSSVEPAMDMRLQSPPATSVHSYSRSSLAHSSGRPPSPRTTAPEFARSRQTSVSVSGHGYHGEYRSHPPEPTVVGGHYDYGHHYPPSYQEPSFPGSQHTAAHLQQQQQQQQQKQQKQQQQHQHQQQQQQQQQQHQPYASQFSHHPAPGYMRPSAHEVDRSHPHGVAAQQHYGHQSYHQQPPSPPLQNQQAILSPPHRGSMPDVHSGGQRLASSQQQQPPPDRPHAENDEALVMNFMSELQMQQQTHGRKQPHKVTSHSVVPPPQPSSQYYQQHPQHPQHPQHQHRQSLHVDHAPLHPAIAQPHPRYAHEDHVGYAHTQDVQSHAYRSQVSTPSQSVLELARPKTPPASVQPSMHISTQGTGDARQRLAMASGLGSGPQSPALDGIPSTKTPLATRKISTPSNQTSLPPPRSLSLMNILNAPETEGNGDTTDTEEERDTAVVLPPPIPMADAGVYTDEGRPFPSRPEQDRDGNAAMYKGRLHDGFYDGQPQKPEGAAEEHRIGQEQVETVATPTPAPLKPTKENTTRPPKEKPAKKAPKEKVVKAKTEKGEKSEKPEKVKKPKAPPKKKISASAIAAQGADEAVTPMDVVPAQSSQVNSVQEPQAGNKHPILETAGESEDKVVKRIRVESRAPEENGIHSSSIDRLDAVQPSERTAASPTSLVMDPTQSAGMDVDESRKFSQDEGVDRSSGLSRTKDELPSPSTSATSRNGRASPASLPETRVETMQSTPVGTQEPTSAHSPRPGTPTQGSLASRYRAPVSDQVFEAPTGSKAASDGPDNSSPLPPPRDSGKGAKDKKASKKKPASGAAQAEEGPGQKPQKPVHPLGEIDTDKTDVKGSGKPPVSRKKPSSSSATASSLKDRFSRPVENAGSPKAAVEELSDPIGADMKIRSSDAGLELSRDKLPKEKRVDHKEAVPDASVKSKASSHEPLPEPPKDMETVRTLPSKEEKGEEQSRSKEEGALYCICRTPYDPDRFMIACDRCDDWFHGDCVGVAEKEIDLVDQYYCKRCEEKDQQGFRKNKCGREGCQKSAGRKSKYCSKECGLLLATRRIRESQEKVFGSPHQQDAAMKDSDAPLGQQQQQHLQRRRRLTLADLDDRQRLLTLREKMAHVRIVCAVLVEREKQLEICVDRQARQDLGKFVAKGSSSQPPLSLLVQEKEGERSATAADEDEDENALRSSAAPKSKSKSKGPKASKDKDKEMLCGFDYSLVWDDAEDMCRAERAALTSLTATPNGSRASSVAPSSGGAVVVVPSKQDVAEPASSAVPGQGGVLDSLKHLTVSPQLQAIGVQVCTARRQCDRHTGWQRLKAAELDLEKTLQVRQKAVPASEAENVMTDLFSFIGASE
ncbi:unnamed protein product [Mortierella alpina]